MMSRIFTIIVIVFGLCLLLWLRTKPNQQIATGESDAQGVSTASTNAAPLPGKHQEKEPHTNASNTKTPPAQQATGTGSFIDKKLLSEWRAPIDFYGKVVDESNNPVAEANIQFVWNEMPFEGHDDASPTQSDANGLFELHGAHGPSLDVRMSKPGYYTRRKDKWSFSYSMSDDNFQHDSRNPVIFHLRKKGNGESLTHVGGTGLHAMRDYRLNANGEPADVSLVDGKIMPEGKGDLEIRFQSGPPVDGCPSRITWQCQITVPGGGLIPTSNEFPFSAPTGGYQPSDSLNITATNWTETASQQYFVKLPNGDYGRINLKIIGAANPYFRMESFVNQNGSQNLEPQ